MKMLKPAELHPRNQFNQAQFNSGFRICFFFYLNVMKS